MEMYAQGWRGEKIRLHCCIGADVPAQCLYEVEPNCRCGPEHTWVETAVGQPALLSVHSRGMGKKDPIPEGCFECCLSALHTCKWTARPMLCVLRRRSQHLGSCHGKNVREKKTQSFLIWAVLKSLAEVLCFENVQQINYVKSHLTSSCTLGSHTCINGRYLISY